MAVAIAIGYLGGHWLDGKFHASPWLTIVGFVAGIGAAIKALVRVTRAYQKKNLEDPANQAAEKPSRQDRPDAR